MGKDPCDKSNQCSNPLSDCSIDLSNQLAIITMFLIGWNVATTTVPYDTLRITVQ